MPLGIEIKVDPGTSAQAADRVTTALHKTEDEGIAAKKAMDNLTASFARLGRAMELEAQRANKAIGNLSDTFARLGRMMAIESERASQAIGNLGEALARVGKYQARMEAEQRKQTAAALSSVKAFDGLADALRIEKQILDQIHGPIKQYQQDQVVLNKLLAEGKINAEQHAAALARSASAAGQQQAPSKSLGQLRGRLLGGETAGALAGGVIGGLVGGNAVSLLTQGISSLVDAWGAHDRAVAAAEKSLRKYFGTAAETARAVELQEISAKRLGVSLAEQTTAFEAVRRSTGQFFLTTIEATKVTEALGEIALETGHDLKAVAEFVTQLKDALRDGKINGDEFQAMVEAFPQAVDAWAKSLGMTREQLQRLAEANKLTTAYAEKGIDAFKKGAQAQKLDVTGLAETAKAIMGNAEARFHMADAVEALTKGLEKQAAATKQAKLDAAVGGILAIDKAARGAVAALGQFGDAITHAASQSEKFDHFTRVLKQGFALTDPINEAKRNLKALDDAWAGTVDKSAGAMKLYRDQRKAYLEVIGGKPIVDYYKEQLDLIKKPEEEWKARLKALNQLFIAKEINANELAIAIKKLNAAYAGIDLSDFGLGFRNPTPGVARMNAIDAEKAVRDAEREHDEEVARRAKYFSNRSTTDMLAGDWGINVDKSAQSTRIEKELTRSQEALKKFGDEASQSLQNVAYSFGDALVDSIMGAETKWDEFVKQMASSFLKDTLRGGFGSIFDMFKKGGATGFDALVPARKGTFLPGFATGGDMLVGGAGSTDSRLAAFRVTPGESIHVRTPQQRAAAQSGSGPRIVNVNVPGSRDAVTEQEFEGMTIRVIERNQPALRSRLR